MSLIDQEKYWNRIADEKEFPTPFRIDEFVKFVSKEMKILDVGCGYGRTLNELYNQGFRNLTGIDYSQKMINRGLREYPYLNLEKNSGDDLPFPDDEFDVIILIGVLTSNIEDNKQDKLISEINRLLKDQGILYLSDFLINTDERNKQRYSKYKSKYSIYGVFELPEGAVLRHHTTDHIFKLTKDFKKLIFQETVYDTMNGHRSNGFYYISKKKINMLYFGMYSSLTGEKISIRTESSFISAPCWMLPGIAQLSPGVISYLSPSIVRIIWPETT